MNSTSNMTQLTKNMMGIPRINSDSGWKKSRLAGFFLLLTLFGCQPDAVPVPGALEYSKAQQALEAKMPIKATEHLARAVQQGHPQAAVAWLQLTDEQLGPLAQLRQLQQWRGGSIDAEVARTLGLWQQPGIAHPAIETHPVVSTCQLKVQPVLSSAVSLRHWQQFVAGWSTSALANLPVCFTKPVLLDSRVLACSEQQGQRIRCDEMALTQLVAETDAQVLLVAAGRGNASYNNGWLQLPENFSAALFRHEFSHVLGFLDEYALSPQVAQDVCRPGVRAPNLLLSASDLPDYARHFGLDTDQLQLTPVATCQQAGLQAFRPVASDSHMQHYELAMPPLYLQLMAKQLETPQQIMPVQYYFAYLAKQQQDMDNWRQLMQKAAAFGYPAAQGGLTAAGLSWSAR